MNTWVSVGKSIFEATFLRKRLPLFVSWAITNRCNCRCKYCKIWGNDYAEVNTQQCLSIIDELSRSGTKRISFTGGEPLLREDIGLIVEYAFRKGIFSIINSNGLLFSDRISEFKNLFAIKLSLDGPRQINDFIRGQGSFDKAIEAIKIAKEHNIKVFLCAVLSMHNLQYIDDILNIAQDFKVTVSFQPATKALLGSHEINPISCSSEEYKRVINKLIQKKLNSRFSKFIYNSITGLKHIYYWPNPKKIPCGGGIIFCRIEANGDLLLCARTKLRSKLNCLELGLGEAFRKLSPYPCGECWCVGVVEANFLLSYNLDVIINFIKLDGQ